MANKYYRQLAERILGKYDAVVEQKPKTQEEKSNLLEQILRAELESERPVDISELRALQNSPGLATRAYRAIGTFMIRQQKERKFPTDRDVLEFYHNACLHRASYYQFRDKSLGLVKKYLETRGLLNPKPS